MCLVVLHELVERGLSVLTVFGVADLLQRRTSGGLGRLGQGVHDIRQLVHLMETSPSDPFHEEPPVPSAQGPVPDGRRPGADDLRPSGQRHRCSPARRGGLTVGVPVPRRCRHVARHPRGRLRLRLVPSSPLDQDLVDQLDRAPQRRDQAPHQSRRDLPQRLWCIAHSSPPSASRSTRNGWSPRSATCPRVPCRF